jgi:hypothetical protein
VFLEPTLEVTRRQCEREKMLSQSKVACRSRPAVDDASAIPTLPRDRKPVYVVNGLCAIGVVFRVRSRILLKHIVLWGIERVSRPGRRRHIEAKVRVRETDKRYPHSHHQP